MSVHVIDAFCIFALKPSKHTRGTIKSLLQSFPMSPMEDEVVIDGSRENMIKDHKAHCNRDGDGMRYCLNIIPVRVGNSLKFIKGTKYVIILLIRGKIQRNVDFSPQSMVWS